MRCSHQFSIHRCPIGKETKHMVRRMIVVDVHTHISSRYLHHACAQCVVLFACHVRIDLIHEHDDGHVGSGSSIRELSSQQIQTGTHYTHEQAHTTYTTSHTNIHTYTHTHIHTYVHTYIHIHTYIHPCIHILRMSCAVSSCYHHSLVPTAVLITHTHTHAHTRTDTCA